ncbi:MAG: ATP synthase F1 subunit delta [Planctomycetaceae bacterium]|nr:ATP synthase F1 subunit delta [Planctomycetaceae bacterium]MCB9952337.1 ATP synthase F1 subunit delta [Planctomycetaceae bacterium]
MSDLKSRPNHVLEDPSAKAIARVYVQAFLDAAETSGAEDPLSEMREFAKVLDSEPAFADLLFSELMGYDEKIGIIDRVVKPRASEFFTNFLYTLAKHERLNLYPLIVSLCERESEFRKGQRQVTVRSASKLSDEQLQRIKDRLQAALSIEPLLVPEVDENLIGGLVIQVGDTVYDGSLRTRLSDMKLKLRERYLHEIQSGRDRFGHSEGN